MTTRTIYSITNKKNAKVYIGSTSNFEKRKAQHLYMIANKKHDNKNISDDALKYDLSDFQINQLSTLENISTKWLLYIESTWIEYIGYHFEVYNINYNTISFGRQIFEFELRQEKLAFRKLRKVELAKINEIVKLKMDTINPVFSELCF